MRYRYTAKARVSRPDQLNGLQADRRALVVCWILHASHLFRRVEIHGTGNGPHGQSENIFKEQDFYETPIRKRV